MTSNNRKIVISSDYSNGDVLGPFRVANSTDVLVDGNGNPIAAIGSSASGS